MNNNNYKKYFIKGNNEVMKKNYNSAIDYYKKSLSLKNNDINCLTALSETYEKIENFTEAIDCYEKILPLENNLIKKMIILNQIGVNYNNLKDYLKAINMFMRVLQIRNDIPDVYNNLGLCYHQIKNFKMSLMNYNTSLALKKDDRVFHSIGDLYFYMKKYDDSIQYYKYVSDFENNPIIKYNCSFPYLAKKNFKEGFKLYENRLKDQNFCHQTKQPKRVEIPQIEYWDGIKQCSNLLIVYEQGIGDNIQYYRFIVELAELYPNMKISYFCKDIVNRLFKEYSNVRIIDNVNLTEYEYKLYIMSVPYILNINTIKPNVNNYINVNNNKIIYWRDKLVNLKKYRIGITYNGLLSSIIDKNIPLTEFNMLFDDNFDFICLHRLNEVNEEDKLKLKDKITFVDIDNDVPFEETIAILNNIDLLITIDTYIVHLAGVLNIKTWLLVGFVSDWRWFSDNTCCWYNSVEILRMTENKQLKYILLDVKEKLKNYNHIYI